MILPALGLKYECVVSRVDLEKGVSGMEDLGSLRAQELGG